MRTMIRLLAALTVAAMTSAQTRHDLEWSIDFGTNVNTVIQVGDVVVWNWADELEHTVNGLGQIPAPNFGQTSVTEEGFEYAYRYDREGVFAFDCGIHPDQMSGTIEVVAAGGNECVFNGRTFDFCHCTALDFQIYWDVDTDEETLDITYDVIDDGWHAMGFSETGNMVGSNVVFGCADFVDDANADYLLGAKSESQVTPEGNQEIEGYSQEIADGRCTVSFTRPFEPDNALEISDSVQNLVAAKGRSNTLTQHAFADRVPFQINMITGEGASPAGCGQDPLPETETETETEENPDADAACVLGNEEFDSCFSGGLDDFNIFWNVNDEEESVSFVFDVPSNGWHAIAFSSDGNMVGSNAVFGCGDFDGSTDFFLGAKAAAQVTRQGNMQITDYEQTIEDGRCTVRFERLMEPEGLDDAQFIKDAEQDVLMARGGANLAAHAPDARVPFRVNIFSGAASGGDLVLDPVRVAHGAMMALAFGLLFPLGILSAHHKKAIYKGKEACGLKIWFHVHRVCMPLGALLSLTGFIMILVHEREFYAEIEHLAIGSTTMALIFIQLSFVRLRPHGPKPGEKPSAERRRWNLAHHWNGRTAAAFAFFNTVFGFTILNPPIAYWIFFFIVSGGIAITYIALEIVSCFQPSDVPQKSVNGGGIDMDLRGGAVGRAEMSLRGSRA